MYWDPEKKKAVHLGDYDTVVEAAVAYARHIADHGNVKPSVVARTPTCEHCGKVCISVGALAMHLKTCKSSPASSLEGGGDALS